MFQFRKIRRQIYAGVITFGMAVSLLTPMVPSYAATISGDDEAPAGDRHHHIILPSQGQDAGAFEQTLDGVEKTIEYFHNLLSFPFRAVKKTGYYLKYMLNKYREKKSH